MKRHRSLHPLSEHHHHVLVQALQIRRADQAPGAKRTTALRRAARTLVGFWKKKGKRHFREEEEVLLPAYARHARLDENPHIMRMLSEHALIRARMEQLEAGLAARRSVEAEVIALGRLLHDHVRLEENQIFPAIESVLGGVELRSLAPRLTRLHPPRRRQ